MADDSVTMGSNFVVGANEPDVHLRNANYPRDFQADLLADIANAEEGHGCPTCGNPLDMTRGIEVGHVFKFGTSMSEKLGAYYLDREGVQHPVAMGSYGIGVGRLLAAAVEQNHDDKGIIWPAPIAPYQVHMVALGNSPEVTAEADRLYEELQQTQPAGLQVLYDDARGIGGGQVQRRRPAGHARPHDRQRPQPQKRAGRAQGPRLGRGDHGPPWPRR